MRQYEVPQPILNSPYDEPRRHWLIREGEEPRKIAGRRPAIYYYRDPKIRPGREDEADGVGIAIELKLVNRIRERVGAWRSEGYPGVTRTTLELLRHWRRDGRELRLFFAQIEAAETIVFLHEARQDLRQGIEIPLEEVGPQKEADGHRPFRRFACKMATGTGKTMVMGMLAAWSILNKVNNRTDARFSDVVVVVCPNVTIRRRLEELDPARGEGSIYVRRDLVPPHLMPLLARGRVLITNWHVLELATPDVGGVGGRVLRAGVERVTTQTITIGEKTGTGRGGRYLTREQYERQVAVGLLVEKERIPDPEGNLVKAKVEVREYVESDAAFVNRVLGRPVSGKRNILVLNDEGHHAYRIRREEPDEDEDGILGESEIAEEYYQEATVWIDGLDRIHRRRGINFCVDLSATPYYVGRAGQETNRPFPWVVSDFGLVEAIESGLVKIPQLAMRDSTGAAVPGYFNIWRWIAEQLSASERGGRRASPKPEAILKYAHTPIAMLGGLWEQERAAWKKAATDPRPPVFIIVCRDTRIAKVLYEWLAENRPPAGVAPSKLEGFRNTDGRMNTIRVDTKVVHETDTGQAKSDEGAWMRFTLDTVGKTTWPSDSQGRPIYPEGFEALAAKLGRPLDPPGRDVRCIVSVAMLTEGWDCNTVTHIIGLRPFTSQLLCEQVVGRALRRVSYDPGPDGMLAEEVARVFGVPFEVVPFKASREAAPRPVAERYHVHAVDAKEAYEIRFPRVEGYTQVVRGRMAVDWSAVPPLVIDPGRIASEVEMKASLPTNRGRPTMLGPGRMERASLQAFRAGHRVQEMVFDLAAALTREILGEQVNRQVPPHVLFPQLAAIVRRYVDEKVQATPPAEKIDLFLSPYYGWAIERLAAAMRADETAGEPPEAPRFEATRGPGSTADVDFWTVRDAPEVHKSHVNRVVADTGRWEQQAAYHIDRDERVAAFVKNAGLGFAVPYLHDGRMHDYQPDFILRLASDPPLHLILETKGYDPLEEIKRAAAQRWVAAVNADGRYGFWRYEVARKPTEVAETITRALAG